MEKSRDFETSAVKMVSQILDEWAGRLSKIGLHTELLEPKKSFDQHESVIESEIEIWFLDNNKNIKDVLEFHLILKGKQVSSFVEIEKWLNENIENMVKEHQVDSP